MISGPTASGKTAFALRTARAFDTVILSCDSRQFYREMNIGTAKPSAEELEQVRHYFINSHSIKEEYSIGDFAREAGALLEELFASRDVVVLCGGSGMYIKALCEGLDDFPEVSPQLKTQLNEWYQQHGLAVLQDELRSHDPDYFSVVDQSNPHRLLRALAVCKASGQPYSKFLRREKSPRPFKCLYLWMHRPRSVLYGRINTRVDEMIRAGQIEEARSLYPQRQLPALQTVGYQELFDHFDGKIPETEAIELIKRNSRRYAKRQTTWCRRDGFWKHLIPDEESFNAGYIRFALEKHISLVSNRSGHTLSVRSGDTVLASLEITSGKNYSFIRETGHPTRLDVARTYLWHEAILRCNPDQPVFGSTPEAPPPLPASYSAHPVNPEDLPGAIKRTAADPTKAKTITLKILN